MKKTLMAAAAVALSLAAAPAFAQDASSPEVYGSIGAAIIGDDFVDLGAVQARVGAKFTPHFGVEVEGAIGVTDDSIGAIDIDLDHQVAGYLVVFMPASENVDFIARVGYSTFQVSATGGGSGSADTVNYGVGMQYNFSETGGVRADYTYMSGDGNANMYSVAYVHKF